MRQKRPIDAIFPWGSDSETDDELNIAAAKCLPDLPVKCDRKQPSIQTASIADGITYQYIPEHTQAGKILAHCERCIEQLRRATGGESLAIYKIGITHSCAPRFELYHTNGWTKMVVMFQSNDLGTIEMLEAALIAQHHHRLQCRNIQLGGEGMRLRTSQPKFEPPYHCYCVAARADEPRWVRG